MGNRRKLLLIIGFPRSGTKLLRAILNNHQEVFITHELLFLPNLLRNWSHYGDLSQFSNFANMHKDIMKTGYFFSRASRGVKTISAKEWYSLCETFDPTDVFMSLIRYETRATEGSDVWLGDKSPNYTTHLLDIKKGVPEAKIIHIVRDVRDAALSARKLWGKNIYRFAQRWADGMRRLQEQLDVLPAADVIEVRYEDLLSRPGDTINNILDFIHLDYQPGMLELEKPTDHMGDTHSVTKVAGNNFGKYKYQLDTRQIRRIESISQDVLRKYNYEVSDPGKLRRIPAWLVAWYALCDIGYRLCFDIKRQRNLLRATRSFIARYRTRL